MEQVIVETSVTPGRREAWILALRLRTLPAAAVPVAVGTALAVRDGGGRWLPAFACLLCAALLQLAANLVNDADDFDRGADTADRVGPLRVVQAGLLRGAEIRRAAALCLALAAVAGSYLVSIGGWPILLAGLSAIAAAVAYTGGPFPYGYRGLGDAFVFVFFGLVAVCGTYYLQTGELSALSVSAAVAIGALATAILVVNNVRDAVTDARAGKRTLAVRLGDRNGRLEYGLLVLVAYANPVAWWLVGLVEWPILLVALSLPMAARLVRDMLGGLAGPALNATLAGTAQLELAFGLLLAVGLLAG